MPLTRCVACSLGAVIMAMLANWRRDVYFMLGPEFNGALAESGKAWACPKRAGDQTQKRTFLWASVLLYQSNSPESIGRAPLSRVGNILGSGGRTPSPQPNGDSRQCSLKDHEECT